MNGIVNIPTKFLFLLSAIVLSACGFHLKGSPELRVALPYQAWYVDGGEVQQALETALRRADGQVVAAPKAQATVRVLNVSSQKDIYTITRAAEVNEYLLKLNITAQVLRQGKMVGRPIEVEVSRVMEYADSQVLGKREEEATIWAEMRADAAAQIVTRLQFIK